MFTRLFLAILFLSGCSCYPTVVKVKEVIDGDTVRLENGDVLRYVGIDTPEVRKRKGDSWEYAPQPFSLEAREFNRNLVEGRSVTVELDVQRRDKYRRLLGYVFINGTFVNAELVKEGLAVCYARPPNVRYAESFFDSQRKARREGKGLWSECEPVPPEEAMNHIGKIQVVRGRVKDVVYKAKTVFLNFGKDWRKDFTVTVFKDSLKFFRDRGIDSLSFYKGKTVEVFGRIRERNGPEIIINTPEEISVLE